MLFALICLKIDVYFLQALTFALKVNSMNFIIFSLYTLVKAELAGQLILFEQFFFYMYSSIKVHPSGYIQ